MGGREAGQGDAHGRGAQDAVGGAGQAPPVERPEQLAGVESQIRAYRAGGR